MRPISTSGASAPHASRPRVLVTLTGGGFLWEAKSLIRALKRDFDLHYVTTRDAVPKDPGEYGEHEIQVVQRISNIAKHGPPTIARNLLRNLVDSRRVIRTVDPDAVLCVGSSIAVGLCVWARLRGKKTVFVESITRVSTLSATARILSGLRLCDRLYVQWPELADGRRRTLYRGTVF